MKSNPRERWKDIPGTQGRYQASTLGRIRSTGVRGKVRVPYKTRPGYCLVNLCPRRKQTKSFLVHRLVLATFRGPPPKGLQCDHKNGIRHDNRLSNLRWVTPSTNSRLRGIRHGGAPWRRGEKWKYCKINTLQVRIARRCHELGLKSATLLASSWGITRSGLSGAIHGRTWRFTP